MGVDRFRTSKVTPSLPGLVFDLNVRRAAWTSSAWIGSVRKWSSARGVEMWVTGDVFFYAVLGYLTVFSPLVRV